MERTKRLAQVVVKLTVSRLSATGFSSEVHQNENDVDELSIFAQGDVDWTLFTAAIKRSLCDEGKDCSEEDVVRHKWVVDGFEILAIASPSYEDDCGIPFSDYTHEVSVLDANINADESRTSQYVCFVRHLAATMGEFLQNRLVIVKNLQSLL